MSALATHVTVAVIGAGAMGSGIAQVALDAGHPVVLHDAAPAAIERALAAIGAVYARLVDKGRISAAQRDERLARLSGGAELAQLGGAGLVIEAIVENLDIKCVLLRQVEALLAPDAIIATNTSSLSVTAIAARLARPGQVVGMHFFNPAPLLPLVEVVHGKVTAEGVLDTIYDTALAWGKVPVHCSSTPGFIVNRVARPFYAEALRLLGERAGSVPAIDAVLRGAGGFRMGAFELMDMIGHDVNYAVTASVYNAMYQDARYTPSLLQKDLVDAGWLGRKSGRGFYDYGGDAAQVTVPRIAPGPAPAELVVEGDVGPAVALVDMAREAGMAVRIVHGAGLLRVDGVALALTDGRSASERAASGTALDIVFDLALDYRAGGVLAVAAADQAGPGALATAAGFFALLGAPVVELDDAPGLVVMRTVAMLVNESAELVQQGVADAAAVDLAMTRGVNYPLGPLAWCDRIGAARVAAVIANLAASYGEDRYRVAPLLRRMSVSNRLFFPLTP